MNQFLLNFNMALAHGIVSQLYKRNFSVELIKGKFLQIKGHFLQISQKRSTVFHKLKIAKLDTYGFIDPALKLIHNYLSKRFFKVNYSYNTWSKISFGVTQDLTLGPISFKIFLSNLFLIMNDVNFVCNADDIYDFVQSKNNIILSLQESTKLIFQLFSDNQVKKTPINVI